MDLAPGLWGSLLPHREDSIPNWSKLLAQVLFQMDLKNFKGKVCVYFRGVGVMKKNISKVPSTWQVYKKGV